MRYEDLPQDVRDRIELASLEREPDAQLDLWRDVADRFPAYLPARLNYAGERRRRGDLAGARALCEQARADLGEEPSILAELALVENDAGEPDAALALAERAIERGSRFVPMLAMRAEILAAQHRAEEAAEGFLSAYVEEPHAWHCLRRYCELKQLPYHSPLEEVVAPVSPLLRQWLYTFIDTSANTPDESGMVPGCDHTLRFARAWAERAGVDPIALYQFLNARGGFCDCEVVFNAAASDAAYDRMAIVGGVVGSDDALASALLERRLARLAEPEPIELDADDDEEDEALLALTEGGSKLLLAPQLVRGGQLGALLGAAFDTPNTGGTFWLVAIAVDDDRVPWLWTSRDGSTRCERLEELASDPQVHELARGALEQLRAALPEGPASSWVEPIALPAASEVPRLLCFGDDFRLRAASADGATSIDANLRGAFHLAPSPDGARFAYVELGRGSETLVLGDVTTGQRRRVMRAEHFDEHLSWIDDRTLYVTTERGGHVLGVDGSVTEGLPARARISRAGALLAWEDDDGIVVGDLHGREHHRLCRAGHVWDLSPLGDALVLTAVEGAGHRVHLWRFAERESRPLTSSTESCYWPSFVADGSAVVCDRDRGHIVRIDLASAEAEVLSEGTRCSRPVAHPTRMWLAWQGRDERGEPRVVTRSPEGTITALPGRGEEPIFWPD